MQLTNINFLYYGRGQFLSQRQTKHRCSEKKTTKQNDGMIVLNRLAFVSYRNTHAANNYSTFILLSQFLSQRQNPDDFSPRHAISKNSFAMAVRMRMVLARVCHLVLFCFV